MRFSVLRHWVQADLLGTAVPRLAAPLLPGVVLRGPSHTPDCRTAFYLTFDDGPDPAGTPALLDRLSALGAPALFFLLGEQAQRHPDLVRRISEAGHTLGVHGWDHTSLWARPGALAGYERAATLLEDTSGRAVHAVRPPYGRLTPGLGRWCRRTGRRLVLWDLMPGDFAAPSPQAVAHRMRSRTRPGSIVVLHEGGTALLYASEALALSVPPLRAAGLEPAVLPFA